jgi:hypothetical protein
MRDSIVSNMSATYGAVLRVYQSSHAGQVGSIQTGVIGVLFDNCTFINNIARRHGSVLAAYSPSRVFFRPFEYTGTGLLYTNDLGFLGRPLQRFGFNGNPNEDPWMATVAPNGKSACACAVCSSLISFQVKPETDSTPTRMSTTAKNFQPTAISPTSGRSSTGGRTLNPQPSTLNPQPSTLNPQPSTATSCTFSRIV